MKEYDTGANRNHSDDKLDYEGFFSPRVMEIFAEYMHENRMQDDGKIRDGDNWQKGIPLEDYMKSGFRHFIDWWKEHRGYKSREGIKKALCGVMFNAMGYLHEISKK